VRSSALDGVVNIVVGGAGRGVSAVAATDNTVRSGSTPHN
jgi:hypothetical protein